MTILSPNDPWPQFYSRRINYNGDLEEKFEDKKVYYLVCESVIPFMTENKIEPKTILIGQRAKVKIQDEISKAISSKEAQALFYSDNPRFMGLNVVLTVDDGLWME